MARKNNKRNRRKAAFYEINKFDYEIRENLAKRQLPPKEILTEEDKKVKLNLGNVWIEVWTSKITTIQTNF